MDCVVGKGGTKTTLLVLSERVLRKELIFKIKTKIRPISYFCFDFCRKMWHYFHIQFVFVFGLSCSRKTNQVILKTNP